ncbi:MAG: diacylglycerol kinase family protein [Flavobacteriia bacterium]|nr:diacylglycerol kinase family protein [Flavobacteriia bacterium]OIP48255.1 MAG: diacylglycerol kinase [Flavobacteriaceae bacterium CG2_30_31_66]PIV96628.1 MAG: diacylglycerol kinase [Flavobacteriaceae bacterium CG17_big_fil_post_rev_8_21_14_2_50_31_13]PIX13590.1 MAG: diacylglycerol kinase [Flavobacteriaceae bacterium CG_4_8_14_3_um_filter_31_8]PIY14465.1 MAG: diacylglycerol kinase [Flavobacteriaceae bacterium CG_4_10_14_3_um_filter_31_253]PIZ10052.1 MAG: diacylglycerol kinase [Flavobacteriac
MKDPNDGFFFGRIKSFKYAFKGLWILLTTEDSIKVQVTVGVFATIMGFYFKISTIEWMFQLIVIGLVLMAEAANTAIEKIANFVHPEYHKKIEVIKDVAAGIPGFAALISLVIAGIIYIPKIIALF